MLQGWKNRIVLSKNLQQTQVQWPCGLCASNDVPRSLPRTKAIHEIAEVYSQYSLQASHDCLAQIVQIRQVLLPDLGTIHEELPTAIAVSQALILWTAPIDIYAGLQERKLKKNSLIFELNQLHERRHYHGLTKSANKPLQPCPRGDIPGWRRAVPLLLLHVHHLQLFLLRYSLLCSIRKNNSA